MCPLFRLSRQIKSEFSIQRFQNNIIYVERIRAINKVENTVEVDTNFYPMTLCNNNLAHCCSLLNDNVATC